MNKAAFHAAVLTYCREAGQTQKALAHAVGLNPAIFSNKMTGQRNASFALFEVKAIIRTLAQWQAFDTQEAAIALLAFLDYAPAVFSATEWATPPLKLLTAVAPERMVSAVTAVTRRTEIPTPPQATPDAPRDLPRHNVPAPLNPLIGRETEINAVVGLLRRADVRLVTLYGTGGVGKTRLAQRVGSQVVDDFHDGVWFVPLAAITQPDLVYAAIAQVFDLKETSTAALADTVLAFLRPRQMLLVLDNFEQIANGAPVLLALLHAAVHLTILITSRSLVQIAGEHEFPVSPLALPAPHLAPFAAPDIADILDTSPAIALFVQRARAVQYDFALDTTNAAAIIAICTQLDGVPLAIELAAPRLKQFTPIVLRDTLTAAASLDVLRSGKANIPPRQQSLRETLAWSYALMPPAEQEMFRAVAVFVSDFSMDAARSVCFAAHVSDSEIRDRLMELCDQSLLIPVPAGERSERWRMLHVVRAFAWEKCVEHGDAAPLQQRYAAYYLTLAENAAPHVEAARDASWLKSVEREMPHMRAVLTWAVSNDPASLLRLVLGLKDVWMFGGHLTEAEQWVTTAIVYGAGRTLQEQTQLLKMGATIAWTRGDLAQTTRYDDALLAIYRAQGDTLHCGSTLVNKAMTARLHGDTGQAQIWYTEGLNLLRPLPGNASHRSIAAALNGLGIILLHNGDLMRADARFAEALTMAEADNNKSDIAGFLLNVGQVAFARANVSEAERLYRHSLALFEELGYMRGVAEALGHVADVAMYQHDLAQAGALYRESLRIRWTIDDKVGIMNSLEALASVATANGQSAEAVTLYAAATALRESMGVPGDPSKQTRYARDWATLQAALSEPAFTKAWIDGQRASVATLVEQYMGRTESATFSAIAK